MVSWDLLETMNKPMYSVFLYFIINYFDSMIPELLGSFKKPFSKDLSCAN